MALCGCRQYDHHRLVSEIIKRWMATNENVYTDTGKMMEEYHVLDIDSRAGGGEYPNQDGCGWTNDVYLKLLHTE